jgi:hypothetical protein
MVVGIMESENCTDRGRMLTSHFSPTGPVENSATSEYSEISWQVPSNPLQASPYIAKNAEKPTKTTSAEYASLNSVT